MADPSTAGVDTTSPPADPAPLAGGTVAVAPTTAGTPLAVPDSATPTRGEGGDGSSAAATAGKTGDADGAPDGGLFFTDSESDGEASASTATPRGTVLPAADSGAAGGAGGREPSTVAGDTGDDISSRGGVHDPMGLRLAPYMEVIAKREGTLDMSRIRDMARQGLPDEDAMGIRALYWKLLLGYLSPKREEWESTLAEHRAQYKGFCDALIPEDFFSLSIPDDEDELSGAAAPTPEDGAASDAADATAGSEPASDAAGSPDGQVDHTSTHGHSPARLAAEDDSNVALHIDIYKDVRRTHSEFAFFRTPETQQTMTRLLYVFAQTNKAVKYVQGMNELLAPLLYVMSKDRSQIADFAEPDTFWCFSRLMAGLQDMFIAQVDSHQEGIYGSIAAYAAMLKKHDPALFQHLDERGVNPQFYAFRWLTTLLAREFDLPDTIRLWDTLLADEESPRLATMRTCVAMVECQRQTLMRGDFSVCLKLLQHYPPVDMPQLLAAAEHIRAKLSRKAARKPRAPGNLFSFGRGIAAKRAAAKQARGRRRASSEGNARLPGAGALTSSLRQMFGSLSTSAGAAPEGAAGEAREARETDSEADDLEALVAQAQYAEF